MIGLSASLMGGSSVQGPQQCLKPMSGKFEVFDAMLYADKPDPHALGMKPAYVIDRGIWADESTRQTVDYAKLSKRLEQLPAADGLIVLDVEHLSLTGEPSKVAKSISTLRQLAEKAHDYGSGRKVGYYGLLPLSEYWRPINGLPGGGFASWRKDNARIAALGRSIDVNLPSLYTYYPDKDGWVRQAEALICEARRISGKPVYAFVWPEYHDSTPQAGQPIPGDYWRLQLQLLRRIADGVVIWGGYDLKSQRAYKWDPNAEWWTVTKKQILDR
jgi:hypothetical protein